VPVTTAISILGLLATSRSASRSAWELAEEPEQACESR